MPNPSSAQETPRGFLDVRLDPLTVRMLHVVRRLRGISVQLPEQLIEEWLDQPERKKSVGGLLLDFEPQQTTPFDEVIRIFTTAEFPGIVQYGHKHMMAAGLDKERAADIARTAIQEMCRQILGSTPLEGYEAKIDQIDTKEKAELLEAYEALQRGEAIEDIAERLGWELGPTDDPPTEQ